MKKVMIVLLSIMTAGLFAGGYYPSYGPGEQCSPIGSTTKSFILFDSITLNGQSLDNGTETGSIGNDPTGYCDSEDCDMLLATYNGECVGWSYLPIVNGGVTFVVELNDGNTIGVENYPSVNSAFAPEVAFNFYDASEGKMYYNVGSSGLVSNNSVSGGSIDVTGSGDDCSTNGAIFSPPEEYCAAGAGCELAFYADGSEALEFDALGYSDASCAGFTACGDPSITALNSAAGADYLTADNSLCEYGGCLDPSASNFVANGTVDNGGCTYLAADVACSYSYDADGTTTLSFSGEAGSSFTCNGDSCDGSYSFLNTTDASGFVTVVEDNGAVDAEGGSVTNSTECEYTMPLPEMTINSLTPGEGSIATDFSGAFDFDGSQVDPVDGLMAGTEYEVTVTGFNASGSGSASALGSTLDFACVQLGSCLFFSAEPSTYSMIVNFDPAENYAGDAEWSYQACVDGQCGVSTPSTSINVPNLQPESEYEVYILGTSQYGTIQSSTQSVTTNEPPEGEVWKLDITAKMAVLGTQLIEDSNNRLGFYYASSEDFYNAGGTGTPLPEASDSYDAYWDVPEPMVPTPDNEIHFYFINDWSEETGWGQEWAYDIRALRDEHYASNNTTVFNGVVVAETGGLGTLTITPGGILPISSASENYVPVYALVNGGDHENDYYKIEGETVIPLTLHSGEAVNVDFIVGNLVPEAADGLTSSSSASADANGNDWKPSSSISFDEDSSCDNVTMDGINYNDQSAGPQFGSTSYELTRCNSYEQRYPATVYHTATSSSGLTESGMETGSRDAGTDGSQSDSESDLQFSTSYTYTVSAENAAGMGASTSTSLTTVDNVDPVFNDLCVNDGSYNNECESVIASSASGEGSGPETDTGLVTDDSDDVHLYHTYTTAHDGIGRLSAGGTDADGLDQSGTPMTITLSSSYSDHEGYLLDASWSGDIELNEDASDAQFTNTNGSSVSFEVSEPNSGNGSSYTFDLAVTDNEFYTNEANGSNQVATSITVTILPEPNEAPVAEVSVPEGQADEVGGGYWQVPHNGDNEYNCDDLVAYEDQLCDDNRASVTLSHSGSYDPDCDVDDPLCEEYDRYWSEAVMGMTYNDLNMNGQYDEGEPCSDGCLWEFDENGIAPAINPGPESHAYEHSQRHSGGGGNIWTLTVVDNYGAENTAARGFYVLPEPNTRAIAASVPDVESGFEVNDDSNPSDDDQVHYIPEGSDVTTISVASGEVFDLDGNQMNYTTTVNGQLVEEASGSCAGGCPTGAFDIELPAGDYTVETCVLDSYEGYEYLMYASAANGATDQVDMSVQPTQNEAHCAAFSFSVYPEPAAVDVTTLGVVTQGMSYIHLSWAPSDWANFPDTDLEEYGESATHYDVQRTTTPTDTDSWANITTLSVVREYSAGTCSGKADIYENYSDNCEDPTDAQASDDGEWYMMGRGEDGNFHFLDEGLEANTTYHYRVFATNSHGRVSGIGNVVSHSTEAKPTMALSRDMSAEIYAAGEATQTLLAAFSSADGLGGHNVSEVSSSYTTYERTQDGDLDANGGFSGEDGADVSGPDELGFSYSVTAWETDHGQSIEVCFLDAGDYWGYDKEGSCLSTATFTGSEEFLHQPYNYEGWHVFGSPLNVESTMDDLFSAGLSDYASGADYIWFNEDGGFGGGVSYEFGKAYFLGLNHDLVSFTMNGQLLTTADGNLGQAGHMLDRGWNLVSSKLVRPVDVDMLTVTDDLGTHTWAEAQTLGIVSGEVLGTDQVSNYESDSFHPWTGFWIHVSKSCMLNVTPHAFDLAKEDVVTDEFKWNMSIEAKAVEGDVRGDIIKLGLGDNASNDIRAGEDTEDIPVITMAESYLDIYMKESNGMTYWKNTKEMISPEEGQAWIINGYSANSNSDVELSWTMDELDAEYDVKMYINGNAIDMREESSIVVNTESLNNIAVIVGNDPLASGLTTPAEFALTDAYPNPFNPVTSMQLALDTDGFTSVKVYNLMGQVVDIIHEGVLNAGFHKVTWNAEVIPSGVYLVKVEQGSKIATQKVMLMK